MSLYERAIRPVLFRFDPEFVHNATILAGRTLGSNPLTRGTLSLAYDYEHPALEQYIAGIRFRNPIGLSAGFDKHARLMHVIPTVGFGFAEIGSITALPYAGNPKPRLKRLTEDHAIVVNYGLQNDGAIITHDRLLGKHTIPIGVNVAKTNRPYLDTTAAIADWITGLRLLHDVGSYVTINLSCPNTGDKTNWCASSHVLLLLNRIERSRVRFAKPVFLKVTADLSQQEMDAIINICRPRRWITGFIIANLVKDRSTLRLRSAHAPNARGGISGKPVMPKALRLVRYAYQKSGDRFVIIGCGGIFTAKDAYAYIRNGASLVQLITGLIYGGPGTIKRINKGLVELLKRDGFDHVSDAIGVDT